MKKRRAVEMAYAMLGISAATGIQLQPEQYTDGLTMLNAMMTSYSGQGQRVGYNARSEATNDQNEELGTPDTLDEAVYSNLAIRLSVTIGKSLTPGQLAIAQKGELALYAWVGSRNMPRMQYTRQTPTGAGNKPYRNMPGQFMQPRDHIGITGGTNLSANGETLDV